MSTISPTADISADMPKVTEQFAQWIATVGNADMTAQSNQWAQHALLDWFAVTIAAKDEPLVQMLIDEYSTPNATHCIPGHQKTATINNAVLINGTAGHALDFDDVNPLMSGHPTAPVAPVVFALAQSGDCSGADVLRAFTVGYEVECRLGDMCRPSHYEHGFHATGTLGTFGAAAAASSLLKLDAQQCANALGIAAAQASGLKSMFGTMTKPLHVGKAAMNGLMAAQLAARGFTANQAGIECEQGFAATQVPGFEPVSRPISAAEPFAVQSNLFKYHAACYLTHSTIEAIRMIREQSKIGLTDLQSMKISVPAGHRKVCDIAEPATGLNTKFSIRHIACMALDGKNTADLGLFSDQFANDPRYVAARKLVDLTDSTVPLARAATVSITTRDHREFEQFFDVAIPAKNLESQFSRLSAKATAIMTPILGETGCADLITAVASLDTAPDISQLVKAAA